MEIINANEVNVLNLGKQGEHLRKKIVFDYSDLAQEFPGGGAVLRVHLPEEDGAYNEASVEYDFDGDCLIWTVTENDTSVEGMGECQLIYSWDGRAKSKVWKTSIGRSITATEVAPPSWQDWMDSLTDLAAQTVAQAERAYNYAQDAENSAEEAAGYAEDASYSANKARDYSASASASMTNAQTYASNAYAYANSANASKTGAQAAANTASQHARSAGESATSALTSENEAKDAAQRASDTLSQFHQTQARATTLEPGQEATAEYIPSENTIQFGIPKGDPSVTEESIEAALGYVPVSPADLEMISDDTNMTPVTAGAEYARADGTYRAWEHEGAIRLAGVPQDARTLVMTNGIVSIKTTTAAFAKVLDAGTYKFHMSHDGKADDESLTYVRATYDQFVNMFKVSDGETVTFDAPVMVGLFIPKSVDYGNESAGEYTDVRYSFYKVTAKDDVARNGIGELSGEVSQLNGDMSKLQGEVDTKAEKTELEETNRSLDALWKLNEGQTYSVEEQVETGVNVAPSGAYTFSVDEVHGKSEQETTNGYNLVDIPSVTPPTTAGLDVLIPPLTIDQTYTLSATNNGDESAQIQIRVNWQTGNDADIKIAPHTRASVQFTAKRECNVMRFYGVNNTVSEIMLEKGSVAHDYEPFTGGIPSPNPEFPQSIHSVEQINVRVTGKNLINDTLMEGSKIYSVPTTLNPGVYYLRRFNQKSESNNRLFFMKDGQWKTISATGTKYDEFEASGGDFGWYNSKYVLTVHTPIVVRISFTADDGVHVTCSTGDYMDAWEPYTEQTYTITPPRALNKIGNYVDKADVKKGKWVYNTESITVPKIDTIVNNDVNGLGMYKEYRTKTLESNLKKRESGRKPYSNKLIDYYGSVSDAIGKIENGIFAIGSNHRSEGNQYIWYYVLPKAICETVDEANLFIGDVTLLDEANVPNEIQINPSDLAILQSLEDIPADHHIIVTDQDGNDVSYLLQYIIKLSEVN